MRDLRFVVVLAVVGSLALALGGCGKKGKGSCVLNTACMDDYAESDCAKMSSGKFEEKTCKDRGFTVHDEKSGAWMKPK